jgi:hypothetical protein
MMRSDSRGHYYPLTLSWTLFFLSIAWFRSQQKKREEDEQNNSNDYKIIKNDTIGPRGASAVKETTSYWKGFMQCLQNPCDPHSNPTGYIALCLAENKLVQEALAVRLMQQGTAVTAFSDSVAYCYSGFLGLPSARVAAASFIEKRFWKRNNGDDEYFTMSRQNDIMEHEHKDTEESVYKDDRAINPDHIAFGSGVGSILSHLFYIIAQKGDVVLIPAPYYTAFEYDAKAIAGCIPIPVFLDNPVIGPTELDLDKAVKNARKVSYVIHFSV